MNTPSQEFAASMTRWMGGDASVLESPGTSVVADVSRAGTRRIACYQMRGHALLPCDPAIIDTVGVLRSADVSLTDADFRSWVASVGGSILGRAIMKSVGADPLRLVDPVGTLHIFDWSKPADLELMQAFVDGCEEADLDAAEVDMDDLDDHAIALLNDEGKVQAFASSRVYEEEVPFGDIGILALPGLRRSGLGRSAVSALVRDVLTPAGVDPMYRCDPDNVGSDRLSAALGFELAASLTVAELPEA